MLILLWQKGITLLILIQVSPFDLLMFLVVGAVNN